MCSQAVGATSYRITYKRAGGLVIDTSLSELRSLALHSQEHGAAPPFTLIGDELPGVVLVAPAKALLPRKCAWAKGQCSGEQRTS